jgi:DNA-binding LytR/AlgR family response regulator
MKLNCAIIDDEPLAVELMAGYVRKTPFLTLCGSFGSGSAAFDMLRDRPVDLLFCDIQMPGLSGMELSRMLPADTRVIFTTAFSRYAVEGFRVNAVDYLLKPISYADFLAAANKALAWFELKNRAETPPPAAAPQSLFVKTEYRLRQIGFDSILYIEGLKDYVKIHVEEDASRAHADQSQIAGRTAARRPVRPHPPLLHRAAFEDPLDRTQPHRLRQGVHSRLGELPAGVLRLSGRTLAALLISARHAIGRPAARQAYRSIRSASRSRIARSSSRPTGRPTKSAG